MKNLMFLLLLMGCAPEVVEKPVYYGPQYVFHGIGIEFTQFTDTKTTKITTVIKGSPAEKAGLHEEDQIIEVEGKPTQAYKDALEISDILRNGTSTISIVVYRNITDEVYKFSVSRMNFTCVPVEYSEENEFIFSIDEGLDKPIWGCVCSR